MRLVSGGPEQDCRGLILGSKFQASYHTEVWLNGTMAMLSPRGIRILPILATTPELAGHVKHLGAPIYEGLGGFKVGNHYRCSVEDVDRNQD